LASRLPVHVIDRRGQQQQPQIVHFHVGWRLGGTRLGRARPFPRQLFHEWPSHAITRSIIAATSSAKNLE